MLRNSLRFDGIGTRWHVESAAPIDIGLEASILDRVEEFDRSWSRFRDDSLIAPLAKKAGSWRLAHDAGPLLENYRQWYDATDGAMNPLVGRALENLGYDGAYSLRPTGVGTVVPTWGDAISWDGETLTTTRPVVLDVGAAGKGYLVDLLCALLAEAGHDDVTVDASGDIRRSGFEPISVALEHPLDSSKAIGVARVRGAICASAGNRRRWGDDLHHLLDATTGLPARQVIAAWAIADTALDADGLATALVVADPGRLAEHFDFEWVRMLADGRVESSTGFDGDLFA